MRVVDLGIVVAMALLSGCAPASHSRPSLADPAEVREVAGTPGESAPDVVLVGYCDYSFVELLGTWSEKDGWCHASGRVFRELQPEGGEWTLYGIGREPRAVISQPPEMSVSEKGVESWHAPLTNPLDPIPGNRGWLAVSGTRPPDRVEIETLGIDEQVAPVSYDHPRTDDYHRDRRTEHLRNLLRMRGYWHADRPVLEIFVVDLNSDGRRDQLLMVDQAMNYYVDLVAAAVEGDSGDLDVSVLTVDACKRYRNRGLLGARILAVADTNGDGLREVFLRVSSLDAVAYEVHALAGPLYRLVLHLDLGVA